MNAISDAYGKILDACAVAAALILLAMVLIVTGDIVLRNVSNSGLIWANEISEYALYLMTLFTAPWLLRRGQHVRLDLVLMMVPARVAWTMEALADVIGIAVCLVLVRYGFDMTYDSWSINAITIKNLVFPEWWLLAPLPAAFALVALEFGFRLRRLVSGEPGRRADATSVS